MIFVFCKSSHLFKFPRKFNPPEYTTKHNRVRVNVKIKLRQTKRVNVYGIQLDNTFTIKSGLTGSLVLK